MAEPFNYIKRVMAGLEIFLRHGGTSITAEHDEIFSGPGGDGKDLTPDELATLEANGWRMYDGEPCNWSHYT